MPGNGSLGTPPDVLISARGIKRLYALEGENVWALAGVDLDIYRGEYVSIMGPSGSGKSTLFNMVGGLDHPTEGEVRLDGLDLQTLGEKRLAFLRCRRIGYIFQTFNLMEALTACENVMLPMTLASIEDDEAETQARKILTQVGLQGREDHRPDELSGGQQQRVAIARALANGPDVILADEPTANLDLQTGEEIIDLLGRLRREEGVTIISATHDHKMLAASDRVVYLDSGKITNIKTQAELDITVGEIEA